MNNINMKVESINRITHMGAVRATEARIQSGIALQTEFQLLNARLSEKADYLQNAEEQIWKLFAEWQGREFDGEIIYPDSFNLRIMHPTYSSYKWQKQVVFNQIVS